LSTTQHGNLHRLTLAARGYNQPMGIKLVWPRPFLFYTQLAEETACQRWIVRYTARISCLG